MKICYKSDGKKKCRKIDCRLKRNRNKKECISNHKFIFGDWDRDGIPNIDDKHPLNKYSKKQVNPEVKLAETLRYLKTKRKSAQAIADKFADETKATKYRVKDEYSTINKLVRRNPYISNDFIGFRYEGDMKRKKIKKRWDEFNRKYKIGKLKISKKNGKMVAEYVGKENKYRSNAKSKNPYRAYHSNFVLGGYGAEYQFRTKKYGRLNDLMHKAWKSGDVDSFKKYEKEAEKLRKRGF